MRNPTFTLPKKRLRDVVLGLGSLAMLSPTIGIASVGNSATIAPASAETARLIVANAEPENSTQTDPVGAAVSFIEKVIDEAGKALTNKKGDDASRLKAFQKVLREALAVSYISQRMVGRTVYSSMSETQLERYKAVFPEYITRQYARQFEGILGQPLEVTDTTTRRDNVFVRTQFIRKEGTPINVDWRTRPAKDGRLEIRDIIVNGNSIVRVKSGEFAAVIERGGVDGLINLLIAEVGEVDESATAATETNDSGS